MMRNFIDIISRLDEQIVFRDEFIKAYNTRKTVVAVNPTRAEWETSFPNGAAGVICANGKIAVGYGDCLAHHEILALAHIPSRDERFRLQMLPYAVWGELWIDDDDQPDDLTVEQIDDLVRARYNLSVVEIEALIGIAVRRFMPNVPVRAIAYGEGQRFLNPSDEQWLDVHTAKSQK